MHISTSNLLTTTNTAVVTGGSGGIPESYMLNKDFSEIYRSGTASNVFRVELDLENIRYIALAGLDVFGVCSSIEFEYWNGVEYITDKEYAVTSNATIMHINVLHQNATKWRVAFNKTFSNLRVGVAYIAAGGVWEVPNGGEMSGYSRPWTTPAFKQRVQTNQGMPTATVIESQGISGTLSFNNISTDDVVDIWVPLQGYAVTEGVFITENANYGDRAYYCYNCVPSAVKAHSQTRNLQNCSMKFSAWTGRTT